jgi:hypothetical protein
MAETAGKDIYSENYGSETMHVNEQLNLKRISRKDLTILRDHFSLCSSIH